MYMRQLAFILALNTKLISLAITPQIPVCPKGFGVPFWQSMWCVKDKIPGLKNCLAWQTLEKAYNKHVVDHLTVTLDPIPKIIHQIWLGSSLPEKYKSLQKTWMDNHPTWQYKLWTDDDIELLGLTNRDMYDATNNYGAKSDIARYEILYRFGGLYVDTDFECLRPFDIFHTCFNFYTGSAHFSTCIAFVAIIGCTPGHPILRECIESLDLKKIKDATCSMDILQSTGPGHFSQAINNHLIHATDACVVFPSGYFYPWPHYNRDQNSLQEINSWLREETFAIHHWHASWNKNFPIK